MMRHRLHLIWKQHKNLHSLQGKDGMTINEAELIKKLLPMLKMSGRDGRGQPGLPGPPGQMVTLYRNSFIVVLFHSFDVQRKEGL